MGSRDKEGDIPVHESGDTLRQHPSSIKHVELGTN